MNSTIDYKTIIDTSAEVILVAKQLRQNYRFNQQIELCDDRVLSPSIILNELHKYPTLNKIIPLSIIATFDKDETISQWAALRMQELKDKESITYSALDIVADNTEHKIVKEQIYMIKEYQYDATVVRYLEQNIYKKQKTIQFNYKKHLLGILNKFLNKHIDVNTFIKKFMHIGQYGGVSNKVHGQVITHIMTSKKIKPALKHLILDKFHRFPKDIRIQVVKGLISDSNPVLDDIKYSLLDLVKINPSLVEYQDIVA